MADISKLPDEGYLRLNDVLSIIPVGRSTWWAKVKSGEYPQPVKLSKRTTAWKVQDIRDLITTIDNNANKAQS